MAVRPYSTRASYATRSAQPGDVVGLDEAIRKLRRLPKAITGRNGGQVRSALMYATLPIAKAIKAGIMSYPADIDHQAIAKDVKRQREKNPQKRGLSEAVNIGLKQQKQPPMWWWLEWGTTDRQTRKGAERGQFIGHSFFRRGFHEHHGELGPRFALKLKKLADKAARDLARSGGTA